MADEGAWCCIPVCINAESFGARVSKLPARDCKGDCVGDCIIKFDFFSSRLVAIASASWLGEGAASAPLLLTLGDEGAECDLPGIGSLGVAEENEARVSVELWTGTDLDALTPTPFFPPRFRGEPSGLVLLCLRRFCFGEPFGVLLPLLPLPFFFRRRCFGDDGIAPWPAMRLTGESRDS